VAHSHYVMDSYFHGDTAKPRREVMRIVASNEKEAVSEAKRLDRWKQSTFYDIRSINSSARSGDKVIFTSRPDGPIAANAS
jgi:hypothetical protein